MTAAERFLSLSARDLRFEVEELYANYIGCLDEERFEAWPGFFTDPCLYRIVPRENFERGLPLSLWMCEDQGYLKDRVTGIRKTLVYAPRTVRRMVSAIRILGWKDGELEVRANYTSYETLTDDTTRVFNVGQYRDKIAVVGDQLKFREKICIYDSLLVPNSLIYPL